MFRIEFLPAAQRDLRRIKDPSPYRACHGPTFARVVLPPKNSRPTPGSSNSSLTRATSARFPATGNVAPAGELQALVGVLLDHGFGPVRSKPLVVG